MQITYLFDPLCGWCYGAGPALGRLAALDGITVKLAPTGLFAGAGARPMDASFAAYAWQSDQRIGRLTGQPFSEDYRLKVLGAEGGLLDSALSTLGVIAAGLEDSARELDILKRLQAARWRDGRDITDRAVVADILAEAGLEKAASRVRTPDAELLAAYDVRVAVARAEFERFGFEGVPSLVVEDDVGRRPLRGNALFGSFEQLTQHLQAA